MTLKDTNYSDFWQASAILVWCPWVLLFLPFNRNWISKQTLSAFGAVAVCIVVGVISFKDVFPGYYMLACVFFTAGAFLGIYGVGAFFVLFLYVVSVDHMPYPLNTWRFALWFLATSAGVFWAARDTYLCEKERYISGEDPPNRILLATIKTGVGASIFFGVIALLALALLTGESDGRGLARYHEWYDR